ncbi:hypothetical protein EV383_4501 [Pseudonocardia sediminis]|uniref:Uncharacterized protein n=1 Tax=Pseudonocardia sediminis TaxID=1397368 RepID=A0A4Q7V0H1_PSEST|nr:hypothetical protein [Pseudonocardia sediminis]RZT87575.1 hypothetical protein EV383_4501 [Pseudonocardia sediminis]
MPGLRRLGDGFEITVAGGPDRDALADEVERARDELVSASLRLRGLYLAPGFVPEGFQAGFAEVFARPTPEHGDVSRQRTLATAKIRRNGNHVVPSADGG